MRVTGTVRLGFRLALAVAALASLGLAASGCGEAGAAGARVDKSKRMVVLGVDGMDPVLLREYMDRGFKEIP